MSPACAAMHIGRDGSLTPCTEPVAYRCVKSWGPLVDYHVCAEHRPPDARLYAKIYFVGTAAVLAGRVVPFEALLEQRRKRLATK